MEVEAAVNRLEALVEKMDLDINYTIQKLASEFSEANGNNLPQEVNPMCLAERLEKLKEEFIQLKTEDEKTKRNQEEIFSVLSARIVETRKRTDDLGGESGIEQLSSNNDDADDLMFLRRRCENPGKENIQPVADVGDTKNEKSAIDLRKENKDFVPVTEEEFSTLSELVRGRSKLDDVNKVYQTLYDHFKKKPKCSLTSKDMSKIGLKVSGATGSAKLKVLTSLKIIRVDKQGNYQM